MSNKKYISLGNRRDKNLADVADPRTALTNLLNNIGDSGTGDTFIAEDIDAIKGLKFERLTEEYILNNLLDIAVKTNDPANPLAPLIPVAPIVTIKDRVSKAKSITGEIPAYRGGLGLDARFIPSTDINTGNVNSTGNDIFIFNNQQIIEPDYWEYGYFEHNTLLDKTFENTYGGIQWTGYFSPLVYDEDVFVRVDTNGLLIIEHDLNETDQWTKLVNIYAKNRTVTVSSGVTNQTVIPVNFDHLNRIGIGDYLSTDQNNKIEEYNLTNSTIILTSPISVTTNQILTFSRTLGETLTRTRFFYPTVEPGKFIKTRISYWFPDDGLTVKSKKLYFVYTGASWPFYHLYSKKPNPPTVFEFRTYLNNSLSAFNNDFGGSGTLGSNYKDITIDTTYINDYVPSSTFNGVRKLGPINISVENNNPVTYIAPGSTLANVEVGNYVVPVSSTTTLPNKTQVKDKLTDRGLILSNIPTTAVGVISVNFVDHRGLVDYMYATSSGTTVTVASTATLSTDFLVMKDGTTAFNRITAITSPTTFTTSSALALSGTQAIFIYSDKGIVDNSKTVFCTNVFGRLVSVFATAGATTLTLNSVTGITTNMVIQLAGFIPDNTIITNITGNVVTLSAAITNDISNGITVTIAPVGTSVNKEICVLPLDTSPPFAPTATGLRTINRGLKADATLTGDFTVKTSNLILDTLSTTITTATSSPTFNRKIRVNNGSFYLLSNTA